MRYLLVELLKSCETSGRFALADVFHEPLRNSVHNGEGQKDFRVRTRVKNLG